MRADSYTVRAVCIHNSRGMGPSHLGRLSVVVQVSVGGLELEERGTSVTQGRRSRL